LPKEKSLAKKEYNFCQEKKKKLIRDIGVGKRKKINQEEILVLPREKNIVEKIYSLYQEIKVYLRKYKVFAKRFKFS